MTPLCDVDNSSGIVTSKELSPARIYPKGVQLFGQGRLVEEVLYVHDGWVKLARVGRDGQETILELALAGAWLGTAAALAHLPSPVSAVTCTPTHARGMLSAVFRRSLQHDRALSLHIHQLHARELCRQSGWLAQVSSLNSRQRLQRLIRQFIVTLRLQASGRGVKISIPLSQRELAQLLAITPEHLNRLLKDMQADGVIRREKGWLIIPDVQRLCPDCEYGDSPWCETSVPAVAKLDCQGCG